MEADQENIKRIVVAGASGFVGMDLLRRLSSHTQVIALTRSPQAPIHIPTHRHAGVYWLQCNLFSLKQTEAALVDSDVAYFLVHSMMPSARFTQGDYENLDLIIADNFSRAAALAGTKKLIYLGGIQPFAGYLSTHLRSRLEVENVLRCRNKNLVALRAGLILGPGGSSSLILVRLVKRLPVLVCPPWTNKLSSPIALRDAVSALVACANSTSIEPGAYDLAGPEELSYHELMIRMADELNVNRFFVKIPYLKPAISQLWVTLITGASRQLVSPLIQSLLVDMIPGRTAPLFPFSEKKLPLIAALHQAELPRVRLEIGGVSIAPIAPPDKADTVVSIQRLALPQGWSALDMARDFANWLPKSLVPIIRLELTPDGNLIRFFLWGLSRALLELEFVESRSDNQRALFFVVGGLLRKKNSNVLARQEFRVVPEQQLVLSAILDFTPALPWIFYILTQAQAHRWVMWRYARRLKRICQKN